LSGGDRRPLLSGRPGDLNRLLESRRAHYDSFATRVDTSGKRIEEVTDEVVASIARARLEVRAPGLEHEIALGHGLLEELPALIAGRGLHGPYVLVTDENVERSLAARVPDLFPRTVLPAGESQKTLHSIEWLCQRFVEHGLDRAGTVIALGGGVMGDLAGFAAATFMRGVRWVNVPTTVLAMVDASVGGKTGVNLPEGKNLVGAFHPPTLVISDPLSLATLPDAERISGMAEVVKHAIIGSPALFRSLEAAAAFGSLRQIEAAVAIKIRIVEADPFERGARARLNFGHTVGHAVEATSFYALRHGEAVAIGMVAEARIAEKLGIADAGLAERITSVLERAGLPTSYRGSTADELRAAMNVDKKTAGRKVRFALPAGIGEVVHGVEVDEGLLMEVLGGVSGGA
jgi:3-dehydroquinate synthase